MRSVKENTSIPVRLARRRIAFFVAFLVALTVLLQYHGANHQGEWVLGGGRTFRKPAPTLLKLELDAPADLRGSEGRASGDRALCDAFESLQRDERVFHLAEDWRKFMPAHIQSILRDELLPNLKQVADREVIERHLGDLLRMLWQTHGTPIFSFWLRFFHLEIDRDSDPRWKSVDPELRSLSFEEHALGMWMGKQVSEGRVESKIGNFQTGGSTEGGDFLADASMLCAYSYQHSEELNETDHGNTKWTDAPNALRIAIGNPEIAKYDDVIHAVVWSHLQFIKSRRDFDKVLVLVGRLCSYLPYNVAYMACGHGIGHGIKKYSGNDGIPLIESVFNPLEVDSFESAFRDLRTRFVGSRTGAEDGTEGQGEILSLTSDGGVKKLVLQRGDPTRGRARTGDTVVTHYIGKFVNGTVFDTSRNDVMPFHFSLGKGQVIKGWDLGVSTMEVGEVCELTVAPEYGYGANGYPPAIPPGATLIFELELLWFNSTGLREEDRAPDKNALSFDLLMLACDRVAPFLRVTPSSDAILEDYAASSCYTGFYHELHSDLVTQIARNVTGALTSEPAPGELEQRVALKMNTYWNENMTAKCIAIAETYLEALWGLYKRGKKSELQQALRRAAVACFYNRGYFQLDYSAHMKEAYDSLSAFGGKCRKIGKEKCRDICGREDLGKNAITAVKGHNFPFALESCMKACTQIAKDHVQPLCWHGLGSNLGYLAKECIVTKLTAARKKYPPDFKPTREELQSIWRGEVGTMMAVTKGVLNECLLLCMSGAACTRAEWENCFLGYLYFRGRSLLQHHPGSDVLGFCDYLEPDPFLRDLCRRILEGFLSHAEAKVPSVGTLALLSGAVERYENATLPNLGGAVFSADGAIKSKVIQCTLEPGEDCFCRF